MSALKPDMARWDTMTAAERDALVATEVMGWESCDFKHGDSWKTHATGCYFLRHSWRPTTNHGDKTEAVRAFCEGHGRHTKVESAFADLVLRPLNRTRTSTWVATILLLDPKDVCRAMLEALAESEGQYD